MTRLRKSAIQILLMVIFIWSFQTLIHHHTDHSDLKDQDCVACHVIQNVGIGHSHDIQLNVFYSFESSPLKKIFILKADYVGFSYHLRAPPLA